MWLAGLLLPSPTSIRGHQSEQVAAHFLAAQGYTILQKNYRCRRGEIDIIAREGQVLCFVEVRSRQSNEHGDPQETVAWRKQQRLIRAAQHYLAHHPLLDPEVRFDVVGITYQPQLKIQLLRGAFEPHSAW